MRKNDMDALIASIAKTAEGKREKSRRWSAADDDYLRKNLGWMTEKQMGQALGRTAVSVRLRWKRDLRLESPSRAANVFTAHQAARMLGVDSHKTAHWVDKGLLPGRLMAGDRKIRLIDREMFEAWVMNPEHWVYFDLGKVRDTELKARLKDAAAAWNDEWWTTKQAAKYHRVHTKDVLRYIVTLKRLPAVQPGFSRGGRTTHRRWAYWFIKKSDAMKVSIMVYRNGRRVPSRRPQ